MYNFLFILMIVPFISNSQEDLVEKEQIHWFSLEDAEILSKKNDRICCFFFTEKIVNIVRK